MAKSFRRILPVSVLAGALMLQAAPADAGEIANTVKTLAGSTMVRERVSLKDVGLAQPIVLSSSDARRDVYVPVPANVPLSTPTLVLNGRYLRADGGRTTYTLSVDGYVVAARSPTDAEGDANVSIGVDGSPRPSGFVRVGLAWSSVTGRFLCEDERSIGNVLQVMPGSYLEYGYDASAVKDIAGAWSALPRKVTLLVASDALDADSYDAAWRIGVTLERAGKAVKVVALPKPGSEIDTEGLEIPPALAKVPAFAALAKGGKVVLSSEAQVGALLLLDTPQLRAHVAIADPALAAGIKAALDAVAAELTKADPAAAEALSTLLARKVTLLNPVETKSVDVRTLAGRPIIAVAPDAAAAASGLFDGLWRRTAIASHLILNTVGEPDETSASVPLASINQAAGNLDVVARGDWTTTFDLGTGLPPGKVPSRMDIDVAAAPGATATSPVASVFLNDHLLGARRLTADGKPEHIAVDVPPYVLLARNTVRVQFQRQPASDNCREVPQAFPAAVLPDSRLQLEDAPPGRDFAGMVAQLSGDAAVLVPEAWRSNAARTLPTVIQVANAAGLSPSRAGLTFSGTNATVTPQKPFLAFDVPVTGASDLVKVAGGRVSIADKSGRTFYDVSGLDHVAVLQAVTGGTWPGISFQTVADGPQFEGPFRLAQGDVAVLGNAGTLATVNSGGGSFSYGGDGRHGSNNEALTWRRLLEPSFWAHNLSWLIPIALVSAFLLLLAMANRAKRRRSGNGG